MVPETTVDILNRLGHFGSIRPQYRTQAQADAHETAVRSMPKFAIQGYKSQDLPKGTKIILTNLWNDPDVVSDIGAPFPGFHQLTGSCVGASEGNAVATTSFVQRKLSATPTVAFVPWWLFAYGTCRMNEGDRGRGEGAVDSVMGKTLGKNGIFGIKEATGLPTFNTDDGLYLTENIEYQYSDGAASVNTQYQTLAATHPMGTVAPLSTSQDICDAIVNGYCVLDGCDLYVGNGSITGTGDNACVLGHHDGRGGHSTCYLGVWMHPDLGLLFLYSNQWPTSTYPKDPAGGGRCCVWTKQADVDNCFRQYGMDGGECMALSHLNYFPAQPAIISWYA